MQPCKLVIRADTPADLHHTVLNAAAAYGTRLTDLMSDDDLLEALRERMGKQGMIVQVEHFETPAEMEELAQRELARQGLSQVGDELRDEMVAAACGAPNLKLASDDEVLKELHERMAPRGLLVQVEDAGEMPEAWDETTRALYWRYATTVGPRETLAAKKECAAGVEDRSEVGADL
jgi:hypothetical protein